MIPLRYQGRAYRFSSSTILGRVTRSEVNSTARTDYILRIPKSGRVTRDLAGYAGVLCEDETLGAVLAEAAGPIVSGVSTEELADGDVVALDPSGQIRVLFRSGSSSNFLFATDRCNSYCVMCSQPPRQVDDGWRVSELLRLVQLIDPSTRELGITGGEPTLLGRDFIRLLRACRDSLPNTALHVLSNGRLFRDPNFVKDVAQVSHPDLVFGIPIYSDLDRHHDHVVQAYGAFEQTIRGIHNLAASDIRVEVRIVVHRLTFERLVPLAEFIYRNLTFASHVAIMGLEPIGFAIQNLEELWIDPWDYRNQLEEATLYLADRGMNVSIYNHQLCTTPSVLWPLCRKSISDWKNEYLPVCNRCAVQSECGGFFASSVQRRYSAHITCQGSKPS